jgi:hypothetical protein
MDFGEGLWLLCSARGALPARAHVRNGQLSHQTNSLLKQRDVCYCVHRALDTMLSDSVSLLGCVLNERICVWPVRWRVRVGVVASQHASRMPSILLLAIRASVYVVDVLWPATRENPTDTHRVHWKECEWWLC